MTHSLLRLQGFDLQAPAAHLWPRQQQAAVQQKAPLIRGRTQWVLNCGKGTQHSRVEGAHLLQAVAARRR